MLPARAPDCHYAFIELPPDYFQPQPDGRYAARQPDAAAELSFSCRFLMLSMPHYATLHSPAIPPLAAISITPISFDTTLHFDCSAGITPAFAITAYFR